MPCAYDIARFSPSPGVHLGVPNDVYHGSIGVSNSALGELLKSPEHYWGLYRDPDRPPRKARQGQLEGTLFHCALFEPHEFHLRYKVGPNVSTKNTNEWKNFVAGLPKGVTAIDEKQYEVAHAQAKSLRRKTDIADLLSRGRSEVTAYWHEDIVIDAETGEVIRILCKCRPDWVYPIDEKRVILLDGKSCPDANPIEFAVQVKKKHYNRQAAYYSDGYAKAADVEVVDFVFAQVESEWPYVSAGSNLSDGDVEAGRTECRRALEIYARCEHTGQWPGYSDSIVPITMPTWGRR